MLKRNIAVIVVDESDKPVAIIRQGSRASIEARMEQGKITVKAGRLPMPDDCCDMQMWAGKHGAVRVWAHRPSHGLIAPSRKPR